LEFLAPIAGIITLVASSQTSEKPFRRTLTWEITTMPKLVSVSMLVVYLSACQSTVNGVDPAQDQAQGGSTFCGRNLALCVVGGALAVGGIAAAASSGYHKHSYSSTSPAGTMGGTTMGGATMGGAGYP